MRTLEDRPAALPAPTVDVPRPLRPPRVYHIADTQPIPIIRPIPLSSDAGFPTSPASTPRGGLVGWGVAGVCALVAATFGFMYSGTLDDGEDQRAQRAELVDQNARLTAQLDATEAALATTEGELATAEGELATAAGELATARTDLTAAEGEVTTLRAQLDDLDLRVADLTAELEAARNAPVAGAAAVDYAPRSSLELGYSVGESAYPALDDGEARCIGGSVIDQVGVDFLLLEYMAYDYPTDQQYDRLITAAYEAADECGVSAGRLGF